MKKFNEFLASLPADLASVYVRKVIFSVIGACIMLASGLFCLFNGGSSLGLFCLAVMAVIIAMPVYEWYLLKKNKVLVFSGICNETNSVTVLKQNAYNYIIISNDDGIRYKCYLPQNKITKFKEGMLISIYAVANNIREVTDGTIAISSPMHVCILAQPESAQPQKEEK